VLSFSTFASQKEKQLIKQLTIMQNVGTNAGLVWQALSNAGQALDVKAIKKATKLKDKEAYAAFGWLLREGKISVEESGEEVLISLI
jgi:hypothetical protein